MSGIIFQADRAGLDQLKTRITRPGNTFQGVLNPAIFLLSDLRTAKKARVGMSTMPTVYIRSTLFCFSSSFVTGNFATEAFALHPAQGRDSFPGDDCPTNGGLDGNFEHLPAVFPF
jgi:hypothetical protein